jgi:transcriptional antiterminator NusG
VSCPKTERAEVAAYRTGSSQALGEHRTVADLRLTVYRHSLRAPERVLTSRLCDCGLTAMAKRWYIIHAYSNFENKVAASIREQVKHRGLEHLFEEIIVPTEKVVEVRHGQKHATERKFFPGYVLTKVELTNDAYHLIRNTPKVAGFLGSHKKPIPISDTEAAHVLQQIQEGIERPKPLVSFEVGDQVQVSDGPFSSFNATVEEIDDTRSRLKVAVSIFGRPTPVELEFSQVKKI